MELKHGSTAFPCELVRGLDGKLYIRSDNHMMIDVIASELGVRIACVGGFENGFCISPDGEDSCDET